MPDALSNLAATNLEGAYRIVSRAVGEARKIEGHAFDEPLFLDRIALVGDVKRRLRQVKARHW